jgi:hypothetical protein
MPAWPPTGWDQPSGPDGYRDGDYILHQMANDFKDKIDELLTTDVVEDGVGVYTVDHDWTIGVGLPAGTPVGTRILRRKQP